MSQPGESTPKPLAIQFLEKGEIKSAGGKVQVAPYPVYCIVQVWLSSQTAVTVMTVADIQETSAPSLQSRVGEARC